MIIEQVINNNVIIICENGQEIILIGRGIGFQKKPGQVVDESRIEKRFHTEEDTPIDKFSELLKKIPFQYFELAGNIISYAVTQLQTKLNQNIYITLTDHINFALQRQKEGMMFYNALSSEVKLYYPKEYRIGVYALNLIKEKTGVELPLDEAVSIAMHLINAEYNMKLRDTLIIAEIISGTVKILEEELGEHLLEDDLRWDWFLLNIKLLAGRILTEQSDLSEEEGKDEFYELFRMKYNKEYNCSMKIAEFIQNRYQKTLSQDDNGFLALIIRRVLKSNKRR